MSDKSRIALGFVAGAVLAAIVTIAVNSGQAFQIEIKGPEGTSFKMKTSGEVNFVDLMGRIFGQGSKMQEPAFAVLEASYKAFRLSSAQLAREIGSLPPDDKLSIALGDLVDRAQGPFNTQEVKYRNIRSPSVVADFDKQAEQQYWDVVSRLRDKCKYGDGFCKPIPTPIKVVAQEGVLQGTVQVCRFSRLAGRLGSIVSSMPEWRVINIQTQDSIYPCPEQIVDKDAYVVANPLQAKFLFGDDGGGAHDAEFYEAPPGYAPIVEKLTMSAQGSAESSKH